MLNFSIEQGNAFREAKMSTHIGHNTRFHFLPKELSEKYLPKEKCVIQAVIFEKVSGKSKSPSKVNLTVAKKIIAICQKASLPTFSIRHVKKKVESVFGHYVKIINSDRRRPCFEKKTDQLNISAFSTIARKM